MASDKKVVETRYNYGEGFKRTIIERGVDRKNRPCNDGLYIEYYNAPGEIIKKRGYYKSGRIDGILLEYYQDGKLSSNSIWEEGKMISLQEFDQQGKIIKDYK